MTMKKWESLYANAHRVGHEKIQALPGVACAFHSVIDGLIKLTPDVIGPVLDADPSLKEAALRGCRGTYPIEIKTPQDFIAGMFSSLSRGAALQLMIREESTYRWALETFGSGELRLGGTSANMARSLAPLNIPVTVYANPLTRELADLFDNPDNIFMIAKTEKGFDLKSPRDAADEKGIFAIHWVFDYSGDFEMDIDGVKVAPKRANRFIPSWNPRNNQFSMNPTFAEGFIDQIDRYSHLLFSGFHILSESYPDGCTCDDVVKPLGEYLQRVQRVSPQLKIHLEMASIASPKVRETILKHIIAHVHSIGLNETELPLLLENLGFAEDAKKLRDHGSLVDFCKGVALFQKETGIRRVHFHNYGYYLCLQTNEGAAPEDSRDALMFAAIMAAARAKNGLFSAPQDIDAGVDEAVCEVGLEQIELLSEALDQPSIAEEGIGSFESFNLAVIPTKLVRNPLFTVGLGDTISSGAFLTE